MPITGEIKVILVNLSDTPFEIKPGERIAQIVVARHERVEWEASETLSDTARERAVSVRREDRLRTCPRHRCRFRRKGREEHEVCGCHRTGGGEGDAAPQCRGGACKPCPGSLRATAAGERCPSRWPMYSISTVRTGTTATVAVGVRRVSRWRNWFIRTCISSSLPILPGAVRRNP